MSLHKLTEDTFDAVFDRALVAYTQERFISDDEIADVKRFFLAALAEFTEAQSHDETHIALKLKQSLDV